MKKFSRDTPYESCQALSPGGNFMFYCDRKRARFYLKNNLAVVVSEDPLVFRLTFEPKGPGQPGAKRKQNSCEKCGSASDLTGHHVIPHEYRRHFSPSMKDHRSDDVVTLCRACHDEYERTMADALKDLLEQVHAAGWREARHIFERGEKASRTLSGRGAQLPQSAREKLALRVEASRGTEWAGVPLGQFIVETVGEELLIDMWRKDYEGWLRGDFFP